MTFLRRLRRSIPWLAAACGVLGFAVYAHGRMSRPHGIATGDSAAAGCTRCHAAKEGAPKDVTMPPLPAPWDLALSPDGETAYVACGPQRRLLVVDLEDGEVDRAYTLPGRPAGLDLDAAGSRLAVAIEDRDEVVVLRASDGAMLGRFPTGILPTDVVFDGAGTHLVVANGRSDDVSVVDLARGTSVRRPAGSEPFVAVRSPDGRTVAVASRRATVGAPDRRAESEVTFLDPATATVLSRVTLPSCHMTEAAVYTPDGSRLLVPTIVARNLLPILAVARGWVMSSAIASIEVATGRVALLPLTEPNSGFADPEGIALTADGKRALVAAGGGNEAALVDLEALRAAETDCPAEGPQRLSIARRYVIRRVPLGANPRGVAAHGSRFVVTERLDDSVATLDAEGAVLSRVRLDARPQDAFRRGERVFHDAKYAFQGAFSCRSCHPGQHSDGLTYDFEIDGVGRNVVLNRSLLGLAGTDPFKWVGTNPTLERQCGPRFAMVLSRADVFPPEAQADLSAFLHSLPPARGSPEAGHIAGEDLGGVARGKAIFERHKRKDGTPIPPSGRCITCHPPPHYTTRARADVGTRGVRDDTGSFDVPHLTGIGARPPFLHDGRARTLEEIWTLPGVGDQHGVVTDLAKADLNDLVEFLKGL